MPYQLGDEWGLGTSAFVQVTFDVSTTEHDFPYAILCENYDAGSHLGISISKVIKGTRQQWWLEKRTMRGIQVANSLVDWLNREIKDVTAHEWGWDRVPFFGPKTRESSREADLRWEERVRAAEPGLKDLIASRARKRYQFAGPNVVLLDSSLGTKRKFEEVGEEEEEEEEEAEKEDKFGAAFIWREQVAMTRKYLTENHRKMRAQGNDPQYFTTYPTYTW